jgi:hypothetical protein
MVNVVFCCFLGDLELLAIQALRLKRQSIYARVRVKSQDKGENKLSLCYSVLCACVRLCSFVSELGSRSSCLFKKVTEKSEGL